MSIPHLWRFAAASVALAATVQAKPSAPSKEEKKPSPPLATPDAGSFLRWLLLQNGGPDAIVVRWSELVRAAAGKQVIPLDPANPADAAAIGKFGAALDQMLPRLNRPDGAVRAANALTDGEIAARVSGELHPLLGAVPGMTVTPLVSAERPDLVYPTLSCVDAASGRAYYFSAALYPTGGREGALRAVSFQAAQGVGRITTDGSCLLVAIEHNGKAGKELTFLNWELIDLAKVSVRCAVGFEADQNTIHQPGAVITDGRKGRD